MGGSAKNQAEKTFHSFFYMIKIRKRKAGRGCLTQLLLNIQDPEGGCALSPTWMQTLAPDLSNICQRARSEGALKKKKKVAIVAKKVLQPV